MENRSAPAQPQNVQTGDYSSIGARAFPQGQEEPSAKRQRISLDVTNRGSFEQDQRYHSRPFEDLRAPYNPYPSRSQPPPALGINFGPPPQSASGTIPDFSFRHQRTDSSSTSSPYASPRTEIPGYSTSNQPYSSTLREAMYQYPQGNLSVAPPRQVPQPAQTSSSYQHHSMSNQLQTTASTTFTRAPGLEDLSLIQSRQAPRPFPTYPISYQSDGRPLFSNQHPDPLLQSRQQQLRSSLPNVLPPLESTVTSGQPRGVTLQAYSNSVVPSIEGHFVSVPSQPLSDVGPDTQSSPLNYTPFASRRREDG